jgi:hypothetical protein
MGNRSEAILFNIVPVHYNELSPQQKQELYRQADFKIEKP